MRVVYLQDAEFKRRAAHLDERAISLTLAYSGSSLTAFEHERTVYRPMDQLIRQLGVCHRPDDQERNL